MLRYYGQDVLDVHTDRMSLRRLRVLLAGLPPESATRYAIAHVGDLADLRWRDETYLLAHLANMSHAQFRVSWSAATHGKSRPPKLDPILPPDELAAERAKREEYEMRTAVKLAEVRKLGARTKGVKPIPEHLAKLVERARAEAKPQPQRDSIQMTPQMRRLRELGAGARKSAPAPQIDTRLRR
ncbi:MAG TPA: hypothetical protein VK045_10245 [Ornithinicoccus sp.]|nr:hypothetical protein [Ornithinicoccus sp.]